MADFYFTLVLLSSCRPGSPSYTNVGMKFWTAGGYDKSGRPLSSVEVFDVGMGGSGLYVMNHISFNFTMPKDELISDQMFEIADNFTVGLTRDSEGQLGLYGFNFKTGKNMDVQWFKKERNVKVGPNAKVSVMVNKVQSFGCN